MEASGMTRRPPQRPPPPSSVSTSSRTHVESINSFRDIQKVHESAHKLVNKGLEADERNDASDAMRCYSEGLALIDMALRVDCERLSSSSDHVDQAKEMQQKMTKTKQQIMYRIQSLQADLQNDDNAIARMEADAPPSYEDAMMDPCSPTEFMDDEMMSLGDSILNGEMERRNLTDATDLFSIEEGVQIFYISPEGYVSAPSYPSSLHIVKLPEGHQAAASHGTNPPAFIHVNDWMYPLVPGSSPALQTSYGAYMFPDLMTQQHGAAVGLLLPDSLTPETRQQFEQMIQSFTVLQTQTVTPPSQVSASHSQEIVSQRDDQTVTKEQTPVPRESQGSTDTSTKISKGIVVAADWISWGLTKGAEKAGQLIRAGSEKIKERTRPGEEDRKVDPRVKKGLVYARKATHVSVQVTGYLVSKLGEATSALAREIAPHLRQKGEKLIPKSVTKSDQNGKSKLDGVVEVAASGLQGFGTIFVTLETAAKTLGKSLTNETVSIVHHKYGAEAGQVAEHSMYTAGNAAMTAFNANSFGVKAVAKRAAKDTGKAILQDLNKNKTDHRGYVPCESSVDHDDDNESHRGAVGGYRAIGGGGASTSGSYGMKQ